MRGSSSKGKGRRRDSANASEDAKWLKKVKQERQDCEEDENSEADEQFIFGGEISPEEDERIETESGPLKQEARKCAHCGQSQDRETDEGGYFHAALVPLTEATVGEAIEDVFKIQLTDQDHDAFLCEECLGTFKELYHWYLKFKALGEDCSSFLNSVRDSAEQNDGNSKQRKTKVTSEAGNRKARRLIRSRKSSSSTLQQQRRESSGSEIEGCVEVVLDCHPSDPEYTPEDEVGLRNITERDKKSKKSKQRTLVVCPQKNCGKNFTRPALLDNHIREEHEQEGPGECHRCGKKFNTIGGLRIHYAAHLRDDQKFVCKQCPKKFRKKESLEHHQKRDHEGFKPHKCNLCDKTFRLRDKLKLHVMVIHENRKPFACPKCEKSFRTKYHLKIHDVSQHIQGGDNSIGCSQCKRKFPDRESLEKHIAVHEQDKPYICATCGKGFHTSARLRLHEKSHQEMPSCLCPVCGKAYKHSRDLKLHEVIHQDESTYRFGCGDCDRRFYRIDLLRVHQSNEKHFSPEVIGPTISKVQVDKTLPRDHQQKDERVSFTVTLAEEEEEDENETDSEMVIVSSQSSTIPKKRKSLAKVAKSASTRDKQETVVHSSTSAVMYHSSPILQFQTLEPARVPGHSAVATLSSISSAISSQKQTFTAAPTYFIAAHQRDRPILHHSGTHVQGSIASNIGQSQTHFVHPSNFGPHAQQAVPGTGEQMPFDFINTFNLS